MEICPRRLVSSGASMGRPRSVRCAFLVVLIGCTEPTEPIEPTSTVEQAGTACADGPTVHGIDVSYYEASVDWTAAHQAGIDFAFIRVTDGVQFIEW